MNLPKKVHSVWIQNGTIYFYRSANSKKYEKIPLPKWANRAIIAENKSHWEAGEDKLIGQIHSLLKI